MNSKRTSYLYQASYVTKTTFFIFVILLLWRMVILQGMVIIQGKVSYLAEVFQICIVYGLISVVIWLNRNNLQLINIDRNFIVIFVIVGAVNSFILPMAFGVFLLLPTFINFWLFISNKLKFEYFPLNIRQISFFIFIILIPLFIRLLRTSATLPDDKTFIEAIFTANLPLVVFEEVIFRGLLWMFLVKEGFKEYQIILIQGILFWFSHLYYFKSDPITFWFWLPLISIMLGIIVRRSKTISPSTIGHYSYNLLLTLIR
jgi:hypothetical protein